MNTVHEARTATLLLHGEDDTPLFEDATVYLGGGTVVFKFAYGEYNLTVDAARVLAEMLLWAVSRAENPDEVVKNIAKRISQLGV